MALRNVDPRPRGLSWVRSISLGSRHPVANQRFQFPSVPSMIAVKVECDLVKIRPTNDKMELLCRPSAWNGYRKGLLVQGCQQTLAAATCNTIMLPHGFLELGWSCFRFLSSGRVSSVDLLPRFRRSQTIASDGYSTCVDTPYSYGESRLYFS